MIVVCLISSLILEQLWSTLDEYDP